MSDEDRDEEPGASPEDTAGDGDEAAADETAAADAFDGGAAAPVGPTDDELLGDAQEDQRRTRAAWFVLVRDSKQVFTLLFANCLFFAGALAAWWRGVPGAPMDESHRVMGLETIRGALIFAIAIYGFWTSVFNIWHLQHKVKPFLINAVLALWVGIGSIVDSISGDRMEATLEALKLKYPRNVYHEITWRMGVIPPGAFLLTIGGLIVAITLIGGFLQGAKKAKAAAASGSGGRRRG